MVREYKRFFSQSRIDEDRLAFGSSSRLDVTPAISNHEAKRELNFSLRSLGQQHAGLRLTTRTLIRIIVETRTDAVERQRLEQLRVNSVDILASRSTSRNIWLVGDNDQQESRAFQASKRFCNPGQYLHLGQASGRAKLAILDQRAI